MYVEKKLDQEIKEEIEKGKTKIKVQPANSEVAWSHVKAEVGEDSEDEWAPMPSKMSGVTTEMAILQDQVKHMFQENQNLSHRMHNMEGTMTEILMHLKNLNLPNQ